MGMRPLMYSKKEAEYKNIGWRRETIESCYFPSRKKGTTQTQFYTLQFLTTFNYEHDSVFFAHCFPYTFSDVYSMLNRVCSGPNKEKVRRTALCKTIAGNVSELLIITNFNSSQEEIAHRKAVIISARVHPGESNASFIMEGLLEFIVSNEKEARSLRDTYVFKIVPMLNPDGVIVGNYRCSLGGVDLNR